jgi:3-dehydroquinate dehydratase-2
MRVLVIHGPNLNMLGKRDTKVYGDRPLVEIDANLKKLGEKLHVEVECFQSNSEGALIDFIQSKAPGCDGVVINAGALTHYSYALRDALADVTAPVIEVHLSNIYAREGWRAQSVIAPIARGQVSGLGWRGYLMALEAMVNELKGKD